MLLKVSIHALLAESDTLTAAPNEGAAGFNPRPPCGERPVLEEEASMIKGFNPRPPCGERREAVFTGEGGNAFQSTPSLRRAT